MKEFFGVIKYEFLMSIKRKSMLIIALLFVIFFIANSFNVDQAIILEDANKEAYLYTAGQSVFFLNLFFPVFVGISAADRAIRDKKNGVKEIINATKITNQTHLFGKYIGVVLSYIIIESVIVLISSLQFIIFQSFPLIYMVYAFTALLMMGFPALFFVIGFSLVCPFFMPIRIYQILFTGYWYWGNYINPEAIPSISHTILNASGRFTLYKYFERSAPAMMNNNDPNAILNIVVLIALGFLVVFAMSQFQNKQNQKA